ncbi:MAG: hypothetical protein ACRYGF_03525 [Janthinobacterium lividum]
MSRAEPFHLFQVRVADGYAAIRPHISALQKLASLSSQPGAMHGLELLLTSQFSKRKHPYLICFHKSVPHTADESVLVGAVLLLEYRAFGVGTGLYATADAFGVRTVVGPHNLHGTFCELACRYLLDHGSRLVLTTWRPPADAGTTLSAPSGTNRIHARSARTVQDTLLLGSSAEETLQRLGKRTRVHLRAARRRFNEMYPEATLGDAASDLAQASNNLLAQLNDSSLDIIDQDAFNHQVRSVCQAPGGFILGLHLQGQWIALIGGWRQDRTTWIEWQCNARGFEKLSLGSVLRTFLFEEEARLGSTHLGFHGGTSHSMLHRFEHTAVTDLLMRRKGSTMSALLWLLPWVYARWPKSLERGNFLWNALCRPGLQWSNDPSSQTSAKDHQLQDA